MTDEEKKVNRITELLKPVIHGIRTAYEIVYEAFCDTVEIFFLVGFSVLFFLFLVWIFYVFSDVSGVSAAVHADWVQFTDYINRVFHK